MAYNVSYTTLPNLSSNSIGYNNTTSGNFTGVGSSAVNESFNLGPGVWLVIGTVNPTTPATSSNVLRLSLSTSTSIDNNFANGFSQNGANGTNTSIQVSRVFQTTNTGTFYLVFQSSPSGVGNSGTVPYNIQITRIA